jgi:hypothetical protein
MRFSDGVLPGQGAFGNGFATLSISASGSIRGAGRLADGVPFAFTSAVGGDGTFPFDVAMHKGKSAARGWLTVVGSSTAVPDQSDLSGQVVWHSDLTTVAKKRNFFTEFETTLTADGSRYTPPMNGDSLLDLSTPLVRLSAGDLRRPLNREVSIRGAKLEDGPLLPAGDSRQRSLEREVPPSRDPHQAAFLRRGPAKAESRGGLLPRSKRRRPDVSGRKRHPQYRVR